MTSLLVVAAADSPGDNVVLAQEIRGRLRLFEAIFSQ